MGGVRRLHHACTRPKSDVWNARRLESGEDGWLLNRGDGMEAYVLGAERLK